MNINQFLQYDRCVAFSASNYTDFQKIWKYYFRLHLLAFNLKIIPLNPLTMDYFLKKNKKKTK